MVNSSAVLFKGKKVFPINNQAPVCLCIALKNIYKLW